MIGAGFLQAFVIRKARELGFYTIAIDKNPNSIGFKDADKHAVIDIVDLNACLRFAKKERVTGVMTAATDYGVLSTSFVAEKMNLPGLHYEVAQSIKNKYNILNTLSKNTVDDISYYREIVKNDNIEKILDSVRFPVMVKPNDGSGSKAVRRANNLDELKSACKIAIDTSLTGKALIEDFVEGVEYGVESFVYKGEINVLAVMEKCMTNPPDYAELGHCIPSNLIIEDRVRTVVKNAINILGINFGGVNMDILITNDNRIYIIDIGARMGGNIIGSHIIPLGTGIDYMEALIRMALNKEINLTPQFPKTSVASKILALKPGEILDLPDFNKIKEQCQVEIYHHLEKGQIIQEYHNNLDGCGYIIATGIDKHDCLKRAEEAKSLIDSSIIRA